MTRPEQRALGHDGRAARAQQRIEPLLITGYSTSACVRASALDAMQLGFIPLVVREACADRHPAPHEANLFDLQAKYAEVISEAEALAVIAAAA